MNISTSSNNTHNVSEYNFITQKNDNTFAAIKLVVPYLGVECCKIAQLNKKYNSLMHSSSLAPLYRKYQTIKEIFYQAYNFLAQSKEDCFGKKHQLLRLGDAISNIPGAPRSLQQKISLIEEGVATEEAIKNLWECLRSMAKFTLDFSKTSVATLLTQDCLFQITEENAKALYHVKKYLPEFSESISSTPLFLLYLKYGVGNNNLFTEDSILGMQQKILASMEPLKKQGNKSVEMYEKLLHIKRDIDLIDIFLEMSYGQDAQDKLELLSEQYPFIFKNIFIFKQETLDQLRVEVDTAVKPFECSSQKEQMNEIRRLMLVALSDSIEIAKIQIQCNSSKNMQHVSCDHIKDNVKRITNSNVSIEYKLRALFRLIEVRLRLYLNFPNQVDYHIVQQGLDAFTQLNISDALHQVLLEITDKIQEMNILGALETELMILKLKELQFVEYKENSIKLDTILTQYKEIETVKTIEEKAKINIDLLTSYIPLLKNSQRKTFLQSILSRCSNLFACKMTVDVMQQEAEALYEFIKAQSISSTAIQEAYQKLQKVVLYVKEKEKLLSEGQKNNLLLSCITNRHELFLQHPNYEMAIDVYRDARSQLHYNSTCNNLMIRLGSELLKSLYEQ